MRVKVCAFLVLSVVVLSDAAVDRNLSEIDIENGISFGHGTIRAWSVRK